MEKLRTVALYALNVPMKFETNMTDKELEKLCSIGLSEEELVGKILKPKGENEMKKMSGEQINNLLKFEGVNVTDKKLDTIELLTEGKEEKVFRFMDIMREKNWFTSLAISEYREEVRKYGRGYITKDLIIKAYRNNDLSQLKELFSELFLESIFDWEIEEMMDKIKQGKVTVEKLYDDYMEILGQGRTCRFGYLINRVNRVA